MNISLLYLSAIYLINNNAQRILLLITPIESLFSLEEATPITMKVYNIKEIST